MTINKRNKTRKRYIMFDAFTLQNLVIGLEESNDVIGFKSVLKRFCDDMGLKYDSMDDNEIVYKLLTTLSNKLDIGVIEGRTVCDSCGSDECIATIDLNLMQYIVKPVILENDQFILSFKRNLVTEGIDAIGYIADSMNEITVKGSGETHKVKDLEVEEDIDNIISFITEKELDRLTDDILEGGVMVYATDSCKECDFSSSYGVFNFEDIVNLLIQGYLEYEQ